MQTPCYAGNVTWVIYGNALFMKGLVLGGKHFCYAGNITWVILGNVIIKEGLLLCGNSLLCRKCHLGYIWECYYYRKLGPRRKHFCHAGNITWVKSGNVIIMEGLLLGGNTLFCRKWPLGLYLGMFLSQKAWS